MKNYVPSLVLFGCAAVLIISLRQLFELRFEHGDVYPPYSTLRADPLGAMAFYESLEKIPGLSVRRDFNRSNRLPEEPGTVYLHFAGTATRWDALPADQFHEIENFLARGNRLVITLFPHTESPPRDDEDATNSVSTSKNEKMTPPRSARKKIKNREEDSFVSLSDEWGCHLGFRKMERDKDVYAPVRVVNQSGLALPDALEWHSGLILTNCNSQWRTIYARGTNAVVMERRFGRGTVVMATDSYFISNEAMSRDRQATLLVWLVGANTHIVFDEAHFGIVETSGVATLMRKYRLHGVVAGLLLIAALFIWKNSTSLVPPHTGESGEKFVTGKDATAGFINLLRRNIAPRDLLAACFAEWKKSSASGRTFSPARLQQAEAVFLSENSLAEKNRQPVETYRKMVHALGNHPSPKL